MQFIKRMKYRVFLGCSFGRGELDPLLSPHSESRRRERQRERERATVGERIARIKSSAAGALLLLMLLLLPRRVDRGYLGDSEIAKLGGGARVWQHIKSRLGRRCAQQQPPTPTPAPTLCIQSSREGPPVVSSI